MPNVQQFNNAVRLFYLGGFKAERPIVTAMGNSYVVPAPFDYLEVPAYIARALIRRNRRPDNGMSVFSQNADLVNRLKMASKAPVQASAPASVEGYTKEQLLAALEKLEMVAETSDSFGEAEDKTPKAKTKKEI